MRVAATLTMALFLALPATGLPETVSRTIGQVTMVADLSQAVPGGVIVVHLRSRHGLGAVDAIFDGRRAPVYDSPHGPRALVPVPVGTPAGPGTLGFEIMARTGRQRVPLDINLAPREYTTRTVTIPETRRYLTTQPSAIRNSRQLLAMLRTESPLALRHGPFLSPVAAPPVPDSFGAAQTYVGASTVEYLTDAIFGEYHRGLDFEVPVGTLVQAPAAGTVLFAGYMSIPGAVVVLDHGQGIVSVLAHLSRVDVHEGDAVEARAPVGASGESGLIANPRLQWRLYVHGVAVDPRVMSAVPD
ncbi:MAG: murein hydrolase activator EnvC family protein [Vicinamibacteria bacterium]